MFSGPVLTSASSPARARPARARACLISYSFFGKADSCPKTTPAVSILFSQGKGRGSRPELQSEAGGLANGDMPIRIGQPFGRIVDEPIGAVEFGVEGTRRDGQMQRRRRGDSTLVHLADHEGDSCTLQRMGSGQ